jgi:multicomponent K+:H+ antiporter subunit A
VFHILNHATFKASLFMAAGIIDHESGTRDIRKLSGLIKLIPFTATLAMVASASMAGVPLLNGFLSKEMFFAETVFINATAWIEMTLPIVATIAGTFSVAYSLRFTVDVFFGPTATDLPHTPHEPPRWMRAPVELLVFTCLVVGIFPAQVVGPLLAAAALPVVGGTLPEYNLAIWHGWNAPMIMSLIAMSCGIILYLLLRNQLKRGRFPHPPVISHFNGKRLFERGLVIMMRLARRLERRISTRRLQTQLFLVVLAAVLAGLIPMLHSSLSWGDRPKISGSIVFVILWLLAIACALGAAWQAKYHRLAALTMVSVCGLMTCVTFVWFSAPDLALTQLAVEVVTTVLILLGLRWLPRRIEEVSPLPSSLRKARVRRVRDLLLSIAVGGGMALLSYAMLTRQTPNDISSFYLSRALPEGGGSNVVNVMLVDFRGFDTLGEITVLVAVALAVFALLRRFRPPKESLQLPAQQRLLAPDVVTDLVNPRHASDTALGFMMVPAVLVRLLLPIAFVVSVYLFMRGHNQPGGGFVAGLVMSVAFILQYMVAGTQWVEAQMSLRPLRWMGTGLLFATVTGLGAMVAGYPFLTTHTWHFALPLLGEIHIASALFFDIGVYAVVVGSTLLILTALAHQSVRGHKTSAQPKPVAKAAATQGAI